MSRAIFQIIGAFVLLAAAAPLLAGVLVLAGYSSRLSPTVSPRLFLFRLVIFVLILSVVRVGLLQLRKWAALILSVLTSCLAVWCIWATVHAIDVRPGDANWLGYLYALVLTLPSILTAKYWRTLVWHK